MSTAGSRRPADLATLAQLDTFDEVIDARSPAEYAEDHIPGAANYPTLNDDERAAVGTLSAQASAFEAKRHGAVLAARNIANHIERSFADRPARWRPLVYCWRGGKRSRALTVVLREIGWGAAQLDGGYKAFRREVIAQLGVLPTQFDYVVVCGETGSAKSRILAALAQQSAQVLDLEALAAHRGSVLGGLPDAPQPTQKRFETTVWDALRRLDPTRPVFVEGESKKIGQLQVPDALLAAMRAGTCVRVEAPLAERVGFLLREYAHFVSDPVRLIEQVSCLRGLYANEVIDRWIRLAQTGAWEQFVGDILEQHYDPAYRRSMGRNFSALDDAPIVRPKSLDDADLSIVASELIALISSNRR